MSNNQIKWKNIFTVIAALLLLLAIPPIWPYGYYQLLRWVIAGSAGFIAYTAYGLERKGWMAIMIGLAILFNPLIPFYLSKEIWVIIDVIAAGIFLSSLRIKNSKQTEGNE